MVDENKPKENKHYLLTPPELYKGLDAEFHFDTDPCPYPRPADFDGLVSDWGKSSYVNPPFYGGATAWVRKAIEENKHGKTVVLVFPLDKWVGRLIDAGAELRNLGDIFGLATEDNTPGKGTGRHIMAFILKGS